VTKWSALIIKIMSRQSQNLFLTLLKGSGSGGFLEETGSQKGYESLFLGKSRRTTNNK
jgi:hypothetical protein